MAVKIPEVKIYPHKLSLGNIKKQLQPRNIVSAMASDGFLPVIALEAFVEAGRTYQAYKRGGFDEARERITEEFSGAVFWLGGVTGLNWLFEKIGRKILKLPNITVDIASDEVRKPLDNFLASKKRGKTKKVVERTIDGVETTVKKTVQETISPKLMARFKFAKVISSVVIANTFIGFILPKINQAITRSYHKNDNKSETQNPYKTDFIKRPEMATFVNNTERDNNVAFKGLDYLKIANAFENNRNVRLLSVDAGTASGRAISARNNNERVEILFRDLSSIYFYMFCMGHVNTLLNRIEQGKGNTTRLDPVSAKFVTEYMQSYLDGRTQATDKFRKAIFGINKELPEGLKAKLDGKKVITLEEFNAEIPNITKSSRKIAKLEKIAQKMANLQPQVKGQYILTAEQVKGILDGGLINNPEFLDAFYKNAHGNTKFLNPFKFIKQSSLDELKADLDKYVESIIKDADENNLGKITTELLNKASKKNFKLNAINWGTGFAISALFLSTLIPKIQYLITRLRTGQNNFPGTEQFRNKEVEQTV